ncbi:MAG: hypothetical protein Q9166_003591 [cf. Caloplaca sp. 2 TL-2023]
MTGQDGHGQDPYQTSTSTNGRYGSQGYQSSDTQSNQRQQQSYAPPPQQPSYTPTATSADHSSTTYARYGDAVAGSNQTQDARGGYGYTPRSSVDTTALGNLAHASSLGQDSRHTSGTRDSSSLQQLINYNRSQQSQAYDGSLAYGNGNSSYGYGQLSDSRENASSTRDGYSRSQYQSSRQNQTTNPRQYSQYGTTASHSSSTPAYAATSEVSQSNNTHSSYHTTGEDQRQNAQPYYSQPGRPASGQSYRASGTNAQLSPQASQSPIISAYRAPTANPNVSNFNAQSTHRQMQTRAPSLQQSAYADNRDSDSTAQAVEKRYSASASNASRLSVQQTNASVHDSGKSQQSPAPHTNNQASKSLEEQVPKTVDPSHVFNHYEYQRRQEAERARKAAEAEEKRKATEAATALKRVSESQLQQTPTSATSTSTSKEKEEQMAAEMRLMIEKMRDYKSKDPSLFSQIWEQVKKTQPAGSTPTIPTLSAKDLASSTPQNQVNGITTVDNGQIISPSLGIGQSINGAGESSGELPDLGRFPAQRRRRGAKSTEGSVRRSKGSKTKESSPQVNGSESSPPIDPAMIDASNRAAQQMSTPSHPPNPTRQITYVNGTEPRISSQADPNTPAPSSAPAMKPPAMVAPSSIQGTPTPAPVQTSTTGGTAWPEHKKWDLAVAAKATLLASPINSSKAQDITAEQILGFLNQNPSFEQLCQMIEAKGLIIERSHFARSLLGAIPDIGVGVRQRQQNALTNRQPPAPVQTPQTNGATHGPQSNEPGYGVLKPDHSKLSQPLKDDLPIGAPTAQMVAGDTKAPSTQPPVEEKPAPPLTKLQMARKRNISELVDLSQLSDDDLPPPPSKIPRTDDQQSHMGDASRPPTAIQGTTKEAYQPTLPMSMPQYSYGFLQPVRSAVPYQTPYPPLPPAHPFTPPTVYPSTAPPPPSLSLQQRELINSEDIVQPIDKHKAKKRKRYNPRTIVRDILIATGRHPTMQPLNYHLEPLRKTFKHVTDVSDLSTFRWDLVDPGGPPALGPTVVGVRGVDTADGNDADDEDQDGFSQRAPRAQVIPRVDSEVGLSVATAAAVPHVSNPPKLLGPQRKRALGNAEQSEQPGQSSQPKPKVDKSWMSSGLNFSKEPPHGSAPRIPQPTSIVTGTPATEPSSGSGIRRRGRPPGAKNKHPRKSAGTPQSTNIPARPRIETTPARPSGLRNTVTSTDGIAVVVPSPSPSIADTKRGRGRPKTGTPGTSQQSTPIHRVYKCQWKDCPAELHNLETLKKHVLKHGDKYKGPFPCLWKRCGKAPQRDDEDTEKKEDEDEPESQPLEYATKEIWAKHVDRRHLADFAWKLGDGPSIRSDSEMSDYLSDSARRRVAPVITNEGRPDPLPLTSSGKPAKLYHKAHGITTELGKAEAFLEASEARRRSLGPGMDRTGATFVTKRKNALLDDSITPLKKLQQADDV